MYISICLYSSGVVWEEKRKRRWKGFSNKVCESLEEAFVKYKMLESAGKSANPLFTTDKLQVCNCLRIILLCKKILDVFRRVGVIEPNYRQQ